MAGNKKTRFNIIDVLIIILILGAIVGILRRYNIVERLVRDSNRDEVRITVLITQVNPTLAESIKNGEDFYIDGDRSFGRLTEHEANNSSVVKPGEDGKLEESEDPSVKDVTAVFTAKGVIDKDGSFKLAGSRFLAAGKTVTVQSMHVQLEGIILSIEQTSGNPSPEKTS
ncbi:MAG: DUF4330 family protein [Clostridia bacterium]|nr:DUF4330 family protein [Clostridia bacterium]